MENPQFAAREELEECYSELPVPEDEFKSDLPEPQLPIGSDQEEPELKGWKAIQKARKRRQYGTQQTSSPSRHDGKFCIHRWRIDEPNGPISEAVCGKCGAHTEFNNSSESDNVTFSERLL